MCPDIYKVGQGISAWSISALAMYVNAFRLLTTTVTKLENDNVVTDSYWTEDQFIQYLNKIFETVPRTAKFGVTDGEMFDAHQNSFTQQIEREYLERLGLSQEMISHYYSFRTGYLIKANCASGVAGSQKTSGKPGTLLNNGIVSKVISNWLLRGEGPQVIIYKGDDFVKHQCELKLDENRKRLLDSDVL